MQADVILKEPHQWVPHPPSYAPVLKISDIRRDEQSDQIKELLI